jgi:hypothetical protein
MIWGRLRMCIKRLRLLFFAPGRDKAPRGGTEAEGLLKPLRTDLRRSRCGAMTEE